MVRFANAASDPIHVPKEFSAEIWHCVALALLCAGCACYFSRMAREDLISAEGQVTDVTGGHFHVRLDSGQIVAARLSGRMKKFRIRVLVGDRVTVGVSPYDPSHGLITHRMRGLSGDKG